MQEKEVSTGRIFILTAAEVGKLCRPGKYAETCIWLVIGREGVGCFYFNRRAVSSTGETLEDRWKKGLTVAKRDGCDVLRAVERRV